MNETKSRILREAIKQLRSCIICYPNDGYSDKGKQCQIMASERTRLHVIADMLESVLANETYKCKDKKK